MKTISKAVLPAMDKNELNDLLQETKETVAKGILKNENSKNRFGVVDLWRMQKKHKTLGSSTK